MYEIKLHFNLFDYSRLHVQNNNIIMKRKKLIN